MDLTEYIRSELFVLIPVLYAIGMVIKRTSIKDWLIPIILGICGIVLAFAYIASTCLPTDANGIFCIIFASVTQGILCASASVYANNIVKQLTVKKSDDKSGNKNV